MILAFVLAGVATPDPLQSALTAAHRDYQAQLLDKFADATADLSDAGRPFKFIGRLHNGQIADGMRAPFYTYDDGKLRLVFSVDTGYAGPIVIGTPKYMVGIVSASRVPTRSYTGTNAFGVKARVQVEKLLENGVVMLERPQGEVSPYASSTPILAEIAARLPPPDRNTFWVEVALPGSEARKLAADAGLLVEGSIAALPDGKLSYCKALHGDATIDRPVEYYGSECWVGAKVSRVAFVRRSTGEVLKEWTEPGGQTTP